MVKPSAPSFARPQQYLSSSGLDRQLVGNALRARRKLMWLTQLCCALPILRQDNIFSLKTAT